MPRRGSALVAECPTRPSTIAPSGDPRRGSVALADARPWPSTSRRGSALALRARAEDSRGKNSRARAFVRPGRTYVQPAPALDHLGLRHPSSLRPWRDARPRRPGRRGEVRDGCRAGRARPRGEGQEGSPRHRPAGERDRGARERRAAEDRVLPALESGAPSAAGPAPAAASQPTTAAGGARQRRAGPPRGAGLRPPQLRWPPARAERG